MAETIAQWLGEIGLSPEIAIFVISLFPILELRGGLIAAALFNIEWLRAFIICFIGNIIPVPFILLFINKIFELLKKWGPMKKIVHKFETKAVTKSQETESKSKWGKILFIYAFVAIPLPGTGAWTGALIAAFMDIRLKYAIPTIIAGVLSAGIIMSVLTYFFPAMFGF